MKKTFSNYLRFTRAERNGSFALLLLALGLFALPTLLRHLQPAPKTIDFTRFSSEIIAFKQSVAQKTDAKSPATLFYFNPNTASVSDFIALGLSEKVANIIENYRKKGGKFRVPTDLKKIWSLSEADYERLLPYIQMEGIPVKETRTMAEKPIVESFEFDPNSVSEADLKRLGLPARTIKSILNYREKGGVFRKKEDLQKIYTLDETDYIRLAPFILCSPPALAQNAPRPSMYSSAAFVAGAAAPLDINLAEAEDWKTLPGVGATRAGYLLQYRDKLGGFCSVDQVAETKGIPDSIFQNIRNRLTLGAREIRKINLNTASAEALSTHPYINKRQAELIVAYRELHGHYQSAQDIAQMRAISDPVWLKKVMPYLTAD